MIDRPDIGYDDPSHTYTIDGEEVEGVSTVAKALANPAPLIAWAFKIGREGDPSETPWNVRKRAALRGDTVHEVLELLARDGTVDPEYLAKLPAEERGHVRSLLRWYLHYRPRFLAVELVVGSREHRYAGRYDIRCEIDASRMAGVVPSRFGIDKSPLVVLVDLKTSKETYPSEHFAQLAGYEGASVEMGYAPTDAQFVLRTSADGTFEPHNPDDPTDERTSFAMSTAAHEDFLAYLAAYRAQQGIIARSWKERDRKARAAAREEARRERASYDGRTLLFLDEPMTARTLAERRGEETKAISASLARLKKDGLVACKGRTWARVEAEPGEVAA